MAIKGTLSALLSIQLRYSLPFCTVCHTGALFIVRRDQSKEVHWFLYGKGMNTAAALQYLYDNEPQRLPFVQIGERKFVPPR